MRKLGVKHVSYGAKATHYPLVGGVLLDTFSAYLGDVFTPAMHQTWASAYEFISVQMIRAADFVDWTRDGYIPDISLYFPRF